MAGTSSGQAKQCEKTHTFFGSPALSCALIVPKWSDSKCGEEWTGAEWGRNRHAGNVMMSPHSAPFTEVCGAESSRRSF